MSNIDFKSAIQILREKADVYEDHPSYPWLLEEDRPNFVGRLMAYELRSTADTLEWINERQKNS